MALIFQFGSNMNQKEINNEERLDGKATPLGVAELDGYQLVFNVWSKGRQSAVASVERKPHLLGQEKVFGVLYHIPDNAINKMRSIEGCNSKTYQEIPVNVRFRDHHGNDLTVKAYSYVGASNGHNNYKNSNRMISDEYKNHIISGMKQFNLPSSYIRKIKDMIEDHNSGSKAVKGKVQKLSTSDRNLIKKKDIVRLRKKFRESLGIEKGDYVDIYSNNNSGTFKVILGPKGDYAEDSVFMSEAVRKILGVNIGDELTVEKHIK